MVLSCLLAHGQATDAHLRRVIQRLSDAPTRIVESVEYSLFAGGKRLRPALVLECAQVCEGSNRPDGSTNNSSALASAAAIELIHTFSLVHDDLPAMDDDDLRRGRPTNHKKFGEALAILAGDAMTSLAYETIAIDAAPELVPALILELARASGPAGMIGGQVLDIDGEHQALDMDQLRRVHRLKTGALIAAACRLGALSARASAIQLRALTTFGEQIGLAFQITDDLLDVTATPEQLGKATGKDASAGKNTYPSLIGIEATRLAADHAIAQAVDALDIFGVSAETLRDIARFITSRSS